MSTNRVPPYLPLSYEPMANEKTGSGTDARTREVPNQSQNAEQGKVTAPERVSPNIRKEAIDGRRRDAKVREPHRVNVKG